MNDVGKKAPFSALVTIVDGVGELARVQRRRERRNRNGERRRTTPSNMTIFHIPSPFGLFPIRFSP